MRTVGYGNVADGSRSAHSASTVAIARGEQRHVHFRYVLETQHMDYMHLYASVYAYSDTLHAPIRICLCKF